MTSSLQDYHQFMHWINAPENAASEDARRVGHGFSTGWDMASAAVGSAGVAALCCICMADTLLTTVNEKRPASSTLGM